VELAQLFVVPGDDRVTVNARDPVRRQGGSSDN
jgi:hypothetical protein